MSSDAVAPVGGASTSTPADQSGQTGSEFQAAVSQAQQQAQPTQQAATAAPQQAADPNATATATPSGANTSAAAAAPPTTTQTGEAKPTPEDEAARTLAATQLQAQMSETWDKIPEATRQALIDKAVAAGGDQAKLSALVRGGSVGDLDKAETQAQTPNYSSGDESFNQLYGAQADMANAQALQAQVTAAEATLANYGRIDWSENGVNSNVLYKPLTPEQQAANAWAAGGDTSWNTPNPQQAMTKDEATAYVATLKTQAAEALKRASDRTNAQNTLGSNGLIQVTERMLMTTPGTGHGIADPSQVYWSDTYGLVTTSTNYVEEKGNFIERALSTVADIAKVATPIAVSAILGPAAGGALAGALGAGAVGSAMATGFATGTINGLAHGQDLDDALRGGVLSAATAGLTNGVAPQISQSLDIQSELGQKIVADVVKGVGQGALTGEDIGSAIGDNLINTAADTAGASMTDRVTTSGGSTTMADLAGHIGKTVTTDALDGGKFDLGADIRGGIADVAGSYVDDRVTTQLTGQGGQADLANAAGDAAGAAISGAMQGKDGGELGQQVASAAATGLVTNEVAAINARNAADLKTREATQADTTPADAHQAAVDHAREVERMAQDARAANPDMSAQEIQDWNVQVHQAWRDADADMTGVAERDSAAQLAIDHDKSVREQIAANPTMSSAEHDKLVDSSRDAWDSAGADTSAARDRDANARETRDTQIAAHNAAIAQAATFDAQAHAIRNANPDMSAQDIQDLNVANHQNWAATGADMTGVAERDAAAQANINNDAQLADYFAQHPELTAQQRFDLQQTVSQASWAAAGADTTGWDAKNAATQAAIDIDAYAHSIDITNPNLSQAQRDALQDARGLVSQYGWMQAGADVPDAARIQNILDTNEGETGTDATGLMKLRDDGGRTAKGIDVPAGSSGSGTPDNIPAPPYGPYDPSAPREMPKAPTGPFDATRQPIDNSIAYQQIDMNKFLVVGDPNTLEGYLSSPGVLLGRVAYNLFGLDAPNATRSASQSGTGTGASQFSAGEISVLGIDNYDATIVNKEAAGKTFGIILEQTANGFAATPVYLDKAQSLLTDTMFETQDKRRANPDDIFRWNFMGKALAELESVKEFKTGGVYKDLNKKSVIVNGANWMVGAGSSLEVRNPFDNSQKIGVESSVIVDYVIGDAKQMSALGWVADRNTGVYGFAVGREERDRVLSTSVTINQGVDLGIVRGKGSMQQFVGVGKTPLGNAPFLSGGGTMSAVWNDKTGTLTLQGTSGWQLGVGSSWDLSGEIQSDYAIGIVESVIEGYERMPLFPE